MVQTEQKVLLQPQDAKRLLITWEIVTFIATWTNHFQISNFVSKTRPYSLSPTVLSISQRHMDHHQTGI